MGKKIKYELRSFDEIRNGDVRAVRGANGIKQHYVNVYGIVAAYAVTLTPYELDSGLSRDEWENFHGSGVIAGFLYDDDGDTDEVYDPIHKFLHFSFRLPKNDSRGETSDLALILEASKNTRTIITMDGEVRSFKPPMIFTHQVYLTEEKGKARGFNYSTHNLHRLLDSMKKKRES